MKNLELKGLIVVLILFFCGNLSFSQSYDVHIGGPDFDGGVNGNPLVQYYLTELKDCRDKYDVFVEFYPTKGYDNASKSVIEVATIEVEPVNDPNKIETLSASTGFHSEFYDLSSTNRNTLDFNVKAFDAVGNLLSQSIISRSTISDGSIEVSEGFFKEIFDMGHSNRTTGTGGGFDPDNPDFEDDVFTYFCGKRISKVVLLAFYQNFLDLTPAQVCEFKALFELQQLNYKSNTITEWTNEYCDLLDEFWESFTGGGSGGGSGGDSTTCECMVINSRVFVDHSVGNATGSAFENCPEVSVQDGYKLYSHDAGSEEITNGDHNWGLFAWTKMGAAKGMYSISHHWTGHMDSQEGEFLMENTLHAGDLKSGIQFSMKCHSGGIIDTECDCSKDVVTDAQYMSRISGRAATEGNAFSSGNGKVKGCMEDFAFLTMFSRSGGEIIQGNGAATCVECESTDTTSFLTDLGTLASGIESIVPTVIDTGGFDLSKIDDYFNAANSVVGLFGDLLINPGCDQPKDTTYHLIDTFHLFTLTPQNDFVSYVMSSRLYGRIHFENDESYHQLRLTSDYYLAAGLESRGDSSCCEEKVGGYSIGHLGEFDYSFTADLDDGDITFDGHEFQIDDPLKSSGIVIEDSDLFSSRTPNSLQRLQRDVAQLFTLIDPDFLKDVFGLDCGPGCTVDMNCYYNCGYYGPCHEDDQFSGENNENGLIANTNYNEFVNKKPSIGIGLNDYNSEENNPNIRKYTLKTDTKVYPNPINNGRSLMVDYPINFYTSISVISSSGQILHRQEVKESQYQSQIADSNLKLGINFIVLKAKDGNVFIEKVIKQ